MPCAIPVYVPAPPDACWKGLPVYLAGCALGLPIGIYLVLHLELGGFHTAIGALLIVYGTNALVKRPIIPKRVFWPASVAVGFLRGITCGIAAFPRAPMTLWCSMRGWDKTRKRGVYRPFILSMQLITPTAITLLHDATSGAAQGSSVFPYHALLFVPGALLGTWFGFGIFHKIADRNVGRLLTAPLPTGIIMIG